MLCHLLPAPSSKQEATGRLLLSLSESLKMAITSGSFLVTQDWSSSRQPRNQGVRKSIILGRKRESRPCGLWHSESSWKFMNKMFLAGSFKTHQKRSLQRKYTVINFVNSIIILKENSCPLSLDAICGFLYKKCLKLGFQVTLRSRSTELRQDGWMQLAEALVATQIHLLPRCALTLPLQKTDILLSKRLWDQNN